MLTDILTLACGLGLAYIFLIIIDAIRSAFISLYRRKTVIKNRAYMKTVYTYANRQVEQPVKEDKKKK